MEWHPKQMRKNEIEVLNVRIHGEGKYGNQGEHISVLLNINRFDYENPEYRIVTFFEHWGVWKVYEAMDKEETLRELEAMYSWIKLKHFRMGEFVIAKLNNTWRKDVDNQIKKMELLET